MRIRARFSQTSAIACALALACAAVSAPAQDAAAKSGLPGTTTSTNPNAGASTDKSGTKTSASTTAHHTAASSSAPHSKSSATHSSKSKQTTASRKGRKRTPRGQQKIDAERAEEIQTALIREHYLTGEATGNWNTASEEAMRRYQADHGWQSKTVPDARALISLGLGPSRDHLLNPESAMTTGPAAPHATALTAKSQSPAPGAATAATPVKVTPTPVSDPPAASPPAQNSPDPQ